MNKKIIVTFWFLLIFSTLHLADAQTLLITKSEQMEEVVFDGKWTTYNEWKESSWETMLYDNIEVVHVRAAHHTDFIYIMLDVINDKSYDHKLDYAIICVDGNNERSIKTDTNDFCFHTSLGGEDQFIYQGNSSLQSISNFQKIPNHFGYIGIGEISDEYDKYSKIPHISYEFKIPINLFGRSDFYGFYILVYDSTADQFYSWPFGIFPKNQMDIPDPSTWGSLVSPDKSLPEFNLPLVIVIPSLILVIFFTKFYGRELK